MKNPINYLPYLLALLPQFIFQNYTLVIIGTILTGLIAAYFVAATRVFGKMFIIELFAFTIVFFMLKDRVAYLNGVLNSFALPAIALSIIFPVFNALNIAILFFTGYKLGRLLPWKLNIANNVNIAE